MTGSRTTLEELAGHGLLDALADGLVVCGAAGTIQSVNHRTEQLSGYRASELIGQPVELLVPDGLREEHRGHRQAFAQSGHPTRSMGVELDIKLSTKHGEPVPVDVALSALPTESEVLVVAAIRDATPRIRQQRSVRAARAVTEAILAGTQVDDIYALICEQAVALVGANLAVVALRSADGRGFDVAAASDPRGRSEELIGQTLSGPQWEDAVRTDHRTLFEEPSIGGRPLGRAVLFPLPEGQRLGFLLVADPLGGGPFGDGQLDAVETFAAQAGLAFAYGRRLRALAVAGDRDRIARDLHDLIIQRLFGAGLSLQVTAQIHAGDESLTRRLNDVIQSLDSAIDELRRSIFDLEQKKSLDFRDRVLIAVQEVISDHRIEASVHVDEPDGRISEDRVAHLLAALREALSNTGRHAQANSVEVSVAVGADLVLVVNDDGIGIGDDVPLGHGLANMRDRAHKLGGDLRLSSPADGGLRLEWRVPL